MISRKHRETHDILQDVGSLLRHIQTLHLLDTGNTNARGFRIRNTFIVSTGVGKLRGTENSQRPCPLHANHPTFLSAP